MKVLQIAQVVVPALAAIMALAMLAVSADMIVFTRQYYQNDKYLRQKSNARVLYEATLRKAYYPAQLPVNRPALIIAVGVISALVNSVLAVAMSRHRRSEPAEKAKTVKSAIVILGADVALLLLSLITTIYSWWHIFEPITAHKVTRQMAYSVKGLDSWVWHVKGTVFDPLNWFCALFPFFEPKEDGYSQARSKCKEGNAVIDLAIVIVLLQALALALHLWTFYSVNKTERKLAEKTADDSD